MGIVTAMPGVEISAREAEVLALLGERCANAEIAERLFISVRTVESHVSSLLRKFGVADRRTLATLAVGAALPGRVVGGLGGIAGLPVPRTSFVGRQQERAVVSAALADARLVTLVGAGGVGKTRLAVELATELARGFPGGGAFVDLVPVRDGFVSQAAAAALGVAPNPQQHLLDAVVQWLGERRCLLVIDNCEHLLDAVAECVERILSGCREVTVLATSRERLGVAGEQVVPVLPLAPESDGSALFHDRAVAADPSFVADAAVVGELCVRLDGVPLAIELAAARSASLGGVGLRAALSDPLRLLSGGRAADERHRSLRAVLDWSYGLLDGAEQALFRKLGVFAGGFDLDAAALVSAVGDRAETADLLGRLVDKSLVVHQRDAGRWRLLSTVRAFARNLLDADPARTDVFDRYLGWASSAAVELAGRLDGDWRADFDAIADDLRAALLNCPPGAGQAPHRLASALGHLTFARRFFADSVSYYRQAAERAPSQGEAARDLRSAADCGLVGTVPGPRILGLLLDAAERAGAAGDGATRAITLARAVELINRFDGRIASDVSHERMTGLLDEARAAADAAGVADDPVVVAAIGVAAAWNGTGRRFDPDPDLAAVAVEAARATADPVFVSAGLDLLGTAAAAGGRPTEARRISTERLALLSTLDYDDPRAAPEIDDIFQMAATTALRAGDPAGALAVARRMAVDDLLGSRSYHSVGTMVSSLLLTGELVESLRHVDALWQTWRRAGHPPASEVMAAVAFAVLGYGLRGASEQVPVWHARLSTVPGDADVDVSRLASVVFVECRLAVHSGLVADAPDLVERAFADFPAFRYDTYAHAAGAELAVVAGLPDAAARVARAERMTEGNAWAAACLARARGRLAGDTAALDASVAGWERIGARIERACTVALLPDRADEGNAELASLGVWVPGG